MVNVPLVGRVAAGQPLLAEQNVENYFPIPMEFMPNAQTFMLTVKGDSMVNAGILDGDLVIVRPQDSADNGQIVVARIEDEATVKRLSRKNGQIWLMPENDAYSPIDGTYAQLIGLVKAVIREY